MKSHLSFPLVLPFPPTHRFTDITNHTWRVCPVTSSSLYDKPPTLLPSPDPDRARRGLGEAPDTRTLWTSGYHQETGKQKNVGLLIELKPSTDVRVVFPSPLAGQGGVGGFVNFLPNKKKPQVSLIRFRCVNANELN